MEILNEVNKDNFLELLRKMTQDCQDEIADCNRRLELIVNNQYSKEIYDDVAQKEIDKIGKSQYRLFGKLEVLHQIHDHFWSEK